MCCEEGGWGIGGRREEVKTESSHVLYIMTPHTTGLTLGANDESHGVVQKLGRNLADGIGPCGGEHERLADTGGGRDGSKDRPHL